MNKNHFKTLKVITIEKSMSKVLHWIYQVSNRLLKRKYGKGRTYEKENYKKSNGCIFGVSYGNYKLICI